MPDWLIEGDPTILVLLAVAAVCAGVAWWKTRQRWLIPVASLAVVLIAALIVLNFLFESDREQMVRKINEIKAAVTGPPRDFNKAFSNFSPDFSYGAHDKRGFRKFCEDHAQRNDLKEVVIWDIRVEDYSRNDRIAHVSFQFKVRAARDWAMEVPMLCKATFRLDPDKPENQWRMAGFKIYPLNMADQAISIPGLD